MSQELKCPQCGQPIGVNHRLCRNCGSRNVSSTNSDNQPKATDINNVDSQKSEPVPLYATPSNKKTSPDPIIPPPDMNSTFYLERSLIPEKKPGMTIGEIIIWGIVLFICGFLAIAIAIPQCYKRASPRAREKACYANMRVILGAIEMYNMDNSIMKASLVDADTTSGFLLKGSYLKSKVQKPEIDCIYSSNGDMTTTGKISCNSHGTVN